MTTGLITQWSEVIHNVAALRATPDGGSEQVSQAIMGDRVRVIETRSDYRLIRCLDDYKGWILGIHLRPCQEAELLANRDAHGMLMQVSMPFAELTTAYGEPITRLVFGTTVSLPEVSKAGTSRVCVATLSGAEGYIISANLQPFGTTCGTLSDMCAVARSFLGTPYLWGGSTPFGFDCSGFVQRVYSAFGVLLPRDAHMQAQSALGDAVPDGNPLTSGDLVFFCGERDPRNRGITHVGMMLDDARMIHASGKAGVTVDSLHAADIVGSYVYRGAWRLRAACE